MDSNQISDGEIDSFSQQRLGREVSTVTGAPLVTFEEKNKFFEKMGQVADYFWHGAVDWLSLPGDVMRGKQVGAEEGLGFALNVLGMSGPGGGVGVANQGKIIRFPKKPNKLTNIFASIKAGEPLPPMKAPQGWLDQMRELYSGIKEEAKGKGDLKEYKRMEEHLEGLEENFIPIPDKSGKVIKFKVKSPQYTDSELSQLLKDIEKLKDLGKDE